MTGTISQLATELSVSETSGTLTVTFLRSGDLSGATRLTYGVTQNSATAGQDYNHAFSTVDFAPGQSRATISIDIINDNLSEPTEVFAVSLITATNGASISVPRTLRVNILDDENPAPPPPAEPPLTSNYLVGSQVLVSGLNQPLNLDFLPTNPNVVVVAEKSGLIRSYNIDTGASLGTFLDLRSVVNDRVDRGLMDVAFHPDFANNPYVYVFYVVDPPGSTPDGNGNRYSHVVRYTADATTGYTSVVAGSAVIIAGATGNSLIDINGGGVLDFTDPSFASQLSSERYINPADPNPPALINGYKQDYIRVDAVAHAGGSLAFGPDGMLYISIGDGASANYADPRASDVQSLNSLAGKILRVDPLTGRGLSDNPFAAGESLDSNKAKIFQYGLRNPYSIGFDNNGQLFITDTGWNTFEEINTAGPGANFGWPWFEGGIGGALARAQGYQDLPPAAAFYAQVAAGTILITAPFVGLGHAASEPGFQNQAITGGSVVYDGNRYPAEFTGEYFFTNFPFGRVFTVDTNNRNDVEFLYQSPSTFAPLHFVQGPDGYIYYADFGPFDGSFSNGSIGRLQIFPLNGPGVTVSAPTFATEGAGAVAQVVFTLNTVQTSDVIVTYLVENGTALNGPDFTSPARAQITIPAGQTSVTLPISLVNDSTFELTETFRVVLFQATVNGAFIAAIDDAVIEIRDDEVPPPGTNFLVNGSFESPSVVPNSSFPFTSVPGWTALTDGRIEVWNRLNGIVPTDGDQSLELDSGGARDGFYQDVTTVAGQVYTLSFNLQTRPGFAVSTQSVEVVWNGVVVGTAVPGTGWGTYTVNLTGTGGANRLTIQEVVSQSGDGIGAMLDNFRLVTAGPPVPSVTVAATPASVTEGTSPSASVTFTLSVPQAVATTVTYSTVNGTAVAGSDFTGATSATAIIPAGQTSVVVQIPILNDTVFEPNETFSVRLDGATAGATALAATGTATITIADNDPAPPGANLLVNGSFEAPVVTPGGYGEFASVTGWTALTGGQIEIWSTHNGVTPTNGVQSLELDSAGARDGFFQDVTTVAGQAYTLSFDLQTRPGFAASTQGVEIVWNGTVVATAVPGAAWSTFTVNVTGTGGANRLTIQEVAAQGGDGLGAMLDNFRLVEAGPPVPSVTVAATPANVTEGAASAAVTFTLSAAQAAATTVTYSTVNGTAVAGADFTGATSATAVIPAGQTSVVVQVPILNDTLFEPSEAFSVRLDGATAGATVLTATGSATITIADNDPAPASVTLAATPAAVTEGTNPTASVTFTLSAVQAADTTVTYSTVNGTAVAGSDFTGATSATAIIPAGQTSVVVQVPILNDTIFEPSESFSVRLDGATAGATALVAAGSATITITDNDPAPPNTNLLVNGSFELPGVAAGGFAKFTSVPGWTALTGGEIEVWNNHRGIVATNGTHTLELDSAGARDGFFQDVTTVAGQVYTLTFDLQTRPGFAASTQSVQVVWNGVVVGTAVPGAGWGTFTVNVTGTGGANRLTIQEVAAQGGDGLGAMLDNFRLVEAGPPVPSVTIAATPAAVTEGTNPTASVTFTLSAVQAADTTVTYSTVNGTAVAGSDFTGATSATAIIPAGQTSVVVQVPILNDTIFEPSETFSVRLDGATAGATALVAAGSATITITDNDPAPPNTNLLVNGSFELPGVAAGGFAKFTSVPGWTALTGGEIEVWNNHRGIVATNGTHTLELDSAGARDGFFQDVTTVAGQVYTLTFDLQTRPGFAASTQSVQVVWNGVVVGTAVPGAGWGTFTVNVTGTGGANRLTIQEVAAQGGDGLGAMLDNFRLVATGSAAETQVGKAIVNESVAIAEGTTEVISKPAVLDVSGLPFEVTPDGKLPISEVQTPELFGALDTSKPIIFEVAGSTAAGFPEVRADQFDFGQLLASPVIPDDPMPEHLVLFGTEVHFTFNDFASLAIDIDAFAAPLPTEPLPHRTDLPDGW